MSPVDGCGFGFLRRDGGPRGPPGSHIQLSEQEACEVPNAERAPEAEARQVAARSRPRPAVVPGLGVGRAPLPEAAT